MPIFERETILMGRFLYLYCIFIAFYVVIPGNVCAQDNLSLEIRILQEPLSVKKITYNKKPATRKDLEKELNKVLFYYRENAFITAGYDSITTFEAKTIAYLRPGEAYTWARLGGGNVDESILSETGFREKIFFHHPLHYKDVVQLEEKILRYCEDNGYPFAEIKLDSIKITTNELSAVLNLNKNKLVRIDSVLIKGNLKIAPAYLFNYLGVKPGSLYHETAVSNVSRRLKELPFLKEATPSSVLFTDKETKLVLNLEKRNASQFDGVIGLLPDNNTGNVLFTGDVHLKLQNAIGRGEQVELNWRSLQKQTQDLKTNLVYPFLFNTPFGTDLDLKIYKRDTTYIDVIYSIGIQYLLSGGNYFKVYVNNRNSTLLSTKGLEFVTVLPDFADVSVITYGAGYKKENLDYRFNPRKGYVLNISGGAGNKTIRQNSKINPAVYKGLTLQSVQYNGEADIAGYISIKNRSTIKIGFKGGMLNATNIFTNELFRIGGLKTLRGFDEESIFASTYSILTLEYRYILEQNSYLYLFADGAYYEDRTFTKPRFIHDTPFGFGGGISFETKAGIFSINYALGKQFNNPIFFSAGKVHFGIVNYF